MNPRIAVYVIFLYIYLLQIDCNRCRYVSENIPAYINSSERDAGMGDFDHAKMTDRNAELKEIVEKENTLRAEVDRIIAELQ